MEGFFTSLFALLFVLSLIGLLSFLLKRYGGQRFLVSRPTNKRLKVADSLMLGPKHRLVLVEQDKKEHLILLGTDQATLIESTISKKSA